MTLRVERYEGTSDVWDALVRTTPGGTHYHRFGWKGVHERVFGHDCPYLAARDEGGRLRGVLPLVDVRSVIFGRYLVSMPYLNYGGPLGTPEALELLTSHAVELARTRNAKLLELRGRVALGIGLPVSHRKITVVLDLPQADTAPLWDGLRPKVRSQIRRPMKEGVGVAFGAEHRHAFYRVFARHMRDLGTPVLPEKYFEAIAEAFGEQVWFGVAYLDSEPIAAGCGFRWGDEFEIAWASSLKAYNRIAPNMLLYWSFLERSVAENVRIFNFGRCTPGSGTHRFKQQWGTRDEPLYWYQWSPKADGESHTPSPDDGAYALGPKLWRRLPVSIATWLGPRIVRGIP